MEEHKCNINCFDNYESKIMREINRKLEYHKQRDSRIPWGSTVDPTTAYSILKKSKGHCAICSCPLKLHDWDAYDPKQFSFDRLRDYDAHHAGNLQVTCYECNVNKAAAMYKKPYMVTTRPRLPNIIFSDELD